MCTFTCQGRGDDTALERLLLSEAGTAKGYFAVNGTRGKYEDRSVSQALTVNCSSVGHTYIHTYVL